MIMFDGISSICIDQYESDDYLLFDIFFLVLVFMYVCL